MRVIANLVFIAFSNIELKLIYFIQLVSQHQTVAQDFKSYNRNAI